jgi:hypothetical protein
MHTHRRILPLVLRSILGVLSSVALPGFLLATLAVAQTRPAPLQPQVSSAAPVSDRDLAATREELLKLLRISPTLTTVIAHDPSLLANQDYVNRNNPQLAQFLAIHPEIARNPDFYLFTRLAPEDGGPDQALQRAVWPEYSRPSGSNIGDIVDPLAAAAAFACFLAALLWMIRAFLENRRWGRIFKLQSEVHGRLIDKFSSNQELALYMDTEAGRRFLEAAPIPVGFEPDQRVPNAIARVLTPLQIGIVLSLLGAGFYMLRHTSPEMEIPMLLLGTVALMPGLGFIISAGITWVLAARLGLLPDSATALDTKSPFHSREPR